MSRARSRAKADANGERAVSGSRYMPPLKSLWNINGTPMRRSFLVIFDRSESSFVRDPFDMILKVMSG
jgi:hypothetical protein